MEERTLFRDGDETMDRWLWVLPRPTSEDSDFFGMGALRGDLGDLALRDSVGGCIVVAFVLISDNITNSTVHSYFFLDSKSLRCPPKSSNNC